MFTNKLSSVICPHKLVGKYLCAMNTSIQIKMSLNMIYKQGKIVEFISYSFAINNLDKYSYQRGKQKAFMERIYNANELKITFVIALCYQIF